ncbi:sema domain, transmembrane domain (TM), and cytoplasmic domain, (semaphorin) 6C isoform X2 [Latimeria chalumnae]|uniref:sema domain, transmembrane domain (TM), and cytoplasmic domain, (semaphorin) 6C isoform X2 n=1 Tax=Latimeria chalumnae TaxID=7897 RepID=UPI00313EBA85
MKPGLSMCHSVFFIALTLWAIQLSLATPFPKELDPINTVSLHISSKYPSFRGLLSDNETAHLGLDFQRMLIIDQKLYIAARDHVYSIVLSHSKEEIVPDRRLTWKTTNQDITRCAVKGKSHDECYNYIKVLVQKNSTTLFACGTNAFNPMCRSYQISTLEQEGEEVSGQARCPFDAKQTNVALFAGGNLYSATMADFQASDAVIYRSLGDRYPVLRTVKYDSKWLREPHFLHAIEYGDFVYFFFREISVEYTTLGRVVFSRVARVCKNDMGGSPRVLEKYWTSFLKARLNCSVPGDSFFYFDVLQSMTDVLKINSRPVVIGVFATQANSITGSGVCAFYMDDIEKAFKGRFKEQKTAESAWTPVSEDKVPKPRPGCCAGSGSATSYKTSSVFPDETLSFIKSYPLLDEAVASISEKPWFTKTSSRYKLTQIAVDVAAGPYRNHTVLFLGSEDGKVLKVLSRPLQSSSLDSLLLEEIDVYNPAICNVKGENRRIVGLELDKTHHALFVAFSSCVIRVPLSRCEIHEKCKKGCLASRDPYCVWLRSGVCATYEPEMSAGIEQAVETGNVEHLGACLGKSTPTRSTTTNGMANPKVTGYSPTGTVQDGRHAFGYGHSLATLPKSVNTEGVRQESDAEESPRSVHFALLIACVLGAFILGAFLSGLFVSCYCSHVLQKTKRMSKDPEATLQRPLSLRSLAKINGFLENEPKGGIMEVTSPKLYSTLLPNEKEQQPNGTTKVVIKDHPELSGLPTPDSTPELPLKNMKAIKNQWEKNQNCNNAKDSQNKSPIFSSPLPNSQIFQFQNSVVLPSNLHGYDPPLANYSDERKIPNSERMLAQQSKCYPQKGVDVNALDELLKHLQEANGNPRRPSGNMQGQPSMSPNSPMTFTNRVQPKIPDTETAPYYSSSTLPRDSLPRRMDVPPDIPPQSTLQRQSRHPSQRHSLSSAHKLMNGVPNGSMLSRQHSASRGTGQPPPHAQLIRMNSTGTPVTLEGHGGYLSRQHSYTDQGSLPRGNVRRSSSIKPDVPPKPMYMPSSPIKAANQFNY